MISKTDTGVDAIAGKFEITDIKIDKDFKTLCPGLLDDELRRLKDNIIKDGEFRDPVIVWEQELELVDGHNRLDVWDNLPAELREKIGPPKSS